MQEFSPQFKAWFRNSKVVDSNGLPIRCYHGTHSEDFDEFKVSSQNAHSPYGFYFTDSPDYAYEYVNMTAPGGRLIPVYLRLENPMNFFEFRDIVRASRKDRTNLIQTCQRMGYDGVITNKAQEFGLSDFAEIAAVKNNPRTFIVFSPNQIKSSIGNNGNYNPEDNRFTESKLYEYREKGSTFSHEGNTYDLNYLFTVSKNILPMDIDVNELKWVLRDSKPESDERVKKSDIKVPLLVTKYKGKILVIDGLHRLAKALKLGKETLPCKFILPEILVGAKKKISESKSFLGRKELFTFMTESKAFRNEAMVEKYSVKELGEILFAMMLSLHIVGSTIESKRYCNNTLKFPKFNHIFLSSTDLCNVISTLRNAREYLNQPNVDVPMIELKRYLRGILIANNTAAFSRAFFFKLQTKLRIKSADLLILRREIVDGESIRDREKLANTLYQKLRQYNNCDLLVLLQILLDGQLTEEIDYKKAIVSLEKLSKKCPFCKSTQLTTLNNELPLRHRCLDCKKEFIEETKPIQPLFSFISENASDTETQQTLLNVMRLHDEIKLNPIYGGKWPEPAEEANLLKMMFRNVGSMLSLLISLDRKTLLTKWPVIAPNGSSSPSQNHTLLKDLKEWKSDYSDAKMIFSTVASFRNEQLVTDYINNLDQIVNGIHLWLEKKFGVSSNESLKEAKVNDRLSFNYEKDIEPENRGFIIDKVAASLEGKEIGYLKIGYIPSKNVAYYYPSIFHYLKHINGWGLKVHSGESANLESEELWRSAVSYANWNYSYVNGPIPPLEKRIEDLKKIAEKYEPRFKEFIDWDVNKPKVEYIRVSENNRRQGIGLSLYVAAAKWLATQNLSLYASTLQQSEAKAAWDYMQKEGYPITTEKTKNPNFKARLKLDYRNADHVLNKGLSSH
jgi:hypothetical protein